MNELISIIVPVYNAEKTLERCVSALLGQIYQNIEIILVNDGSKDRSLEICQHFAAEDSRVHIIDKPNGGVSSARNAGLNVANGEFIMFCDSDDWAEPDWCECLLRRYIPDSLMMCDFSETTSFSVEPNSCRVIETIDFVKRSDFIHYREKGIGSPTTKIFCRRVIENNQIRFPEKLFLGEDLIFVLKYLCAISGDIVYIHRRLYNYYIVNSESLSKQSPSYEQCELFYHLLYDTMESLHAQDPASIEIRNSIVLCDYEKAFIHIAKCNSLSLKAKFNQASEARNFESFRECSKTGIISNNKRFMNLYRKKWVNFLMVYYLIKTK